MKRKAHSKRAPRTKHHTTMAAKGVKKKEKVIAIECWSCCFLHVFQSKENNKSFLDSCILSKKTRIGRVSIMISFS
ncbi:LOW QUALITY PROTEIN: hypothetical protein TorRG33x02_222550 [Trema orientale]|uniref:Uncharacterized protein n=1 Tax=Trema orientale TaxID=63057 RepID=A0A2P5E8Q8_TREOI|nr:LOW QUALITY PROTEIN: hypothetical protein TorRG33x02_222550 [Trema orientale]